MMFAPFWLQRIAIFLVSAVVIAAEIILMRELALRFWEHLAGLVISIALLGFGTSGTVLLVLHKFTKNNRTSLQLISLVGMSLSFPLSLLWADHIDLDLIQLVWQPSQFWKLGAMELALGAPFLFAGMFIGLALQDEADRIPGHYGASFLGSGAGGILVLPALALLAPRILILTCSIIILSTAFFYTQEKATTTGWFFSFILLAFILFISPYTSKISEDKDLPQILAMPGSKTLTSLLSPIGLFEIVEAPAVHSAPGLSMHYVEQLPEQVLITHDAQVIGSLYKSSTYMDYAFMDWTTHALPYHMGNYSKVLLGDSVGNEQIGFALFHKVKTITALTVDESLSRLLSGNIVSSYITNIYQRPEVTLRTGSIRGLLQEQRTYDLIILPTIRTNLGGLTASTADSLLTLETFRNCLTRLEDNGIIAITSDIHSPPRDSFRLLNMFIRIMQENDSEPHRHIAIIRNWATITIAVTKSPLTTTQTDAIRRFCHKRGFDLVLLPDLHPEEINRYHLIEGADYYTGAKSLLGQERDQFTSNYIYDISSPDDSKPFFHHFQRWWSLRNLAKKLGERSRAYIELGVLFLIAALVQAFFLSLILIVFPLIPGTDISGIRLEHLPAPIFFSAIGFGFMFLEVGLIQRLTVYFSHPVYAAATALSGFLFFGGIGSAISSYLKEPLIRIHGLLGVAVVVAGAIIIMLLNTLLPITEQFDLPGKVCITILLIGPLATLMGMIFPLGMKRIRRGLPELIPWCWSSNGFTSVLAALCAPLLAMQWGFNSVLWAGLFCYSISMLMSFKLPR